MLTSRPHRAVRFSALVAAALPIALLGATPAPAGFEYELIIIEPWDQEYALASSGVAGLNNLNEVSGCASTGSLGGPCSFLWTLDGGKVQIDYAGVINDAGVIAEGNYIRWPDGTFQELDGLFNDVGDINESNVLAGSTGSVGTCMGNSSDAAIWDPVNGTTVIGTTFGIFADDEAWAINEVGQVVGVRTSTGDCGSHKAFLVDFGTGEYTDLHAELVGQALAKTEAYDINDLGVVVGEGPVNGLVRPFLWSAAAGFSFPDPLPGTPLDLTHLRAINNAGQAVGSTVAHAIIWDEANGVRNLNLLAERPPGFNIDEATAINENGWIIGRGHTGSWSPSRAVVLRPIDGPTQLIGDVDRDGDVDVDDVVAVILAWGPCTTGAVPCAADVDQSGVIDVDDLVAVVLNWS